MSNNYPIRGQDQIVEDLYRLGAVVHESPTASIFETEYGAQHRPAVIRIRPLAAPNSERFLARWEAASELDHPNLVHIFAAGQSVVNDVAVCYAVTERAEETLATVLALRTLSEAETREMLAPVLTALSYLHHNGYAHSNIKPSNILAVDDVVKISSDDITPVRDGGTPSDDMRSLGEMIVQTTDPHASEILRDVVRNCLDANARGRWTADQVLARLNGESPNPLALPAARRVPKWIYGGLAALVLVVVLMAFVRRDRDKEPVSAVEAPRAEQTIPSITPETVALEPKSLPPPQNRTEKIGNRRADGWSVIVGAYTSPEPAQKRQNEMARKWSHFNWSVLRQQAGKTWYLVVIGQDLSEDEAETLRNRAVTSGLPGDIYIKRTR